MVFYDTMNFRWYFLNLAFFRCYETNFPLQQCDTFYHHYRDQSLEIWLHSALLHVLCPEETGQAPRSSRCQPFSFTAWPCTIKPLVPIAWNLLRLHMYWSNSLVQDNYDLSVHHSENSSPLYWSISSTRERFGCSSRSSSTWDLRGFEFTYKEENLELKGTGNAKTTVFIPFHFMCWVVMHSIFIGIVGFCGEAKVHLHKVPHLIQCVLH